MDSNIQELKKSAENILKPSIIDREFYRKLMDTWSTAPETHIDELKEKLNIPKRCGLRPCQMSDSGGKNACFLIKSEHVNHCFIVVNPFYYGDDQNKVAFLFNNMPLPELDSKIKPPYVEEKNRVEHHRFVSTCLETMKGGEKLNKEDDMLLKKLFSIPLEASIAVDDTGALCVGPMPETTHIEVDHLAVRKTEDAPIPGKFTTIKWG